MNKTFLLSLLIINSAAFSYEEKNGESLKRTSEDANAFFGIVTAGVAGVMADMMINTRSKVRKTKHSLEILIPAAVIVMCLNKSSLRNSALPIFTSLVYTGFSLGSEFLINHPNRVQKTAL